MTQKNRIKSANVKIQNVEYQLMLKDNALAEPKLIEGGGGKRLTLKEGVKLQLYLQLAVLFSLRNNELYFCPAIKNLYLMLAILL